MPKAVKYPFYYSIYLIIIWSAYRLSSVVVPEALDEFLIKPAVWLLPIVFLIHKEKKWLTSLGFTGRNLIPGIYLALLLGVAFTIEAFVVIFIKTGNLEFLKGFLGKFLLYPLFISLGTAFSEEVAFRGFIFNRYLSYFKNEILANLLTSILWVVIHIPASFALLGYNFYDAFSYWFLAFLYSIGAGFIFARTKNIYSAIALYVFWELALLVFR